MSTNEGTGNANGTSSYFSNYGSAEGNGANFFDHNPAMMNQWGGTPTDQNSLGGGFPFGQQHQQQQPSASQQSAPQFYNPADFQKPASSPQPEIVNPYPAGNFFQPQGNPQGSPQGNHQQENHQQQENYQQQTTFQHQDSFQQPQDGFQQQASFHQHQNSYQDNVDNYQQQGNYQNQEGYQQYHNNQQQYQQQHDYYGYGHHQHGQPDNNAGDLTHSQDQKPESDQHPGVVYHQQQQSWHNYTTPSTGNYNHSDIQNVHWPNQDAAAGYQPQDSQLQHAQQDPNYIGTNTNSSNCELSANNDQSTPEVGYIDQEDTSSCSGFGAFFHDDGPEIGEMSNKLDSRETAEISDRTSTYSNLPNSGTGKFETVQGNDQENSRNPPLEQPMNGVQSIPTEQLATKENASLEHDSAPSQSEVTLTDNSAFNLGGPFNITSALSANSDSAFSLGEGNVNKPVSTALGQLEIREQKDSLHSSPGNSIDVPSVDLGQPDSAPSFMASSESQGKTEQQPVAQPVSQEKSFAMAAVPSPNPAPVIFPGEASADQSVALNPACPPANVSRTESDLGVATPPPDDEVPTSQENSFSVAGPVPSLGPAPVLLQAQGVSELSVSGNPPHTPANVANIECVGTVASQHDSMPVSVPQEMDFSKPAPHEFETKDVGEHSGSLNPSPTPAIIPCIESNLPPVSNITSTVVPTPFSITNPTDQISTGSPNLMATNVSVSKQNQGQLVTDTINTSPISNIKQPTFTESQMPPPPPPSQANAPSGLRTLPGGATAPVSGANATAQDKLEREDSSKERSDSLSSGSHPSAFRQVRSHHGHRDMSVNPSPPLWQAEVPSLPGNILLAPAALNIKTNFTPLAPSIPLSAPSDSTPRQLAASIAAVSVPPPPAVVNPLILGNPIPSNPTIANPSNPTASSTLQNVSMTSSQTVQQITQTVSQLDINKTVPHTLPSVVASAASIQHPQVSQQANVMSLTSASNTLPGLNPQIHPQPQLSQPSQSVQSNPQQPSANTVSSTASVVAAQPPDPATQPLQQQNPATQQVQQQTPDTQLVQPPNQGQLAGGVPPTLPPNSTATGQGVAEQSQQQGATQGSVVSQGQPQGYSQFPGSGQWYPQQSPDRPTYPQGYYANSPYGPGYRGYNYDPYASQYGRGHPYSRQDPYYRSQIGSYGRDPRTPQRTLEGQQWERPQSRQGVVDRPRSRQGYYDYDYDPRYARSRRDPRAYGGVDEYGRPYDRRYYDYYYSKRYSAQYKESREKQYDYDKSSQQYSQDGSAITPDSSFSERRDSSQNQSFSAAFHHQGGNTPEQYGPNQSAIQSQGYDYYDHYRKGYGYEATMGYDGSGSYYESQRYQQAEPAAAVTPPPPERNTPVKHALPHVIARFSPGGQLIKVLPNVPDDGMPAVVEIHSIETMVEQCEEIEEYRNYPGPLIKGETHKNDVIHFASSKASDCQMSTTMTDRESAALLWDLLVLLCRQNGTVVETDISDLLLKDHPITTREAAATASDERTEEAESTQEGADISSVLNETQNHFQEMTKHTRRFRELLLFGRKKEALEWAMKRGLWGHALLLASKMDNRAHASVMTRFANSLPMNDPLQTLYQLMSDRQPAAVTSCNDEKWGDWRPHLAMVMSNLSSSAEVGFKSVVTLGDTLAARGLLHASQFCYLMAQISFGIYGKKTSKMVLLGSSHSLPFNKFATNPAIQLTEIYEYAQMLAKKHYLIPNFQAYKFIYACRLAEFGFTSQALRYCETIAETIQYSANYYNSTLVSQLCRLSHRLKHHDPEFHDMRDITEPHWIAPLENILAQMNEGQLKPPSSSGTPMPWVESCSNLSVMGGESTDGTSQPPEEGGALAYPNYIDEGFPQDASQLEQSFVPQEFNQYQSGQAPDEHHQVDPNQQVPHYEYNQQQEQQQQQLQYQEHGSSMHQDGMQHGGMQQPYYGQHYGNVQPYNSHPIQSHLPNNQDLGASVGSNYSEYSTTSNATATGTEEDDTTEYEKSTASQFDFNSYNQMQGRSRTNTQSSMGGPPSPQKTITPPESPKTFVHQPRKRTTSGGSTTSQRSGHREPQQNEVKTSKQQAKPMPKASGGGWFRWFNKKFGGSNIHLPDDTKKTIEWDPVKKIWVDTAGGGDEADSGPPPPPPSDKEIAGSAPPSGAPAPPSSTGANARGPGANAPPAGPGMGSSGPPPAGANKFSRKFGSGNYVDVLNKGQGSSSLAKTSAPSNLFQTLPAPASTAPVNFFIPDSSAADDAQDGQPQVGNPGSRPHSPSQEQGTPQNENTSTHPPPMMPQEDNTQQQQQQSQQNAPGVPMFYNPQQFSSQQSLSGFPPSGGAAPGGGSGTKRGYGAPRQYPKQR